MSLPRCPPRSRGPLAGEIVACLRRAVSLPFHHIAEERSTENGASALICGCPEARVELARNCPGGF